MSQQIATIHQQSRQTYGAPRIHAALNSRGFQVGRHRVARLMAQAGICVRPKRRFNEKLDKQSAQVRRAIQEFATGTPVRVVTPTSANIFYGVVISIDQKARSGNPAAPNGWQMRILVADSAKQLILPLSKVNTGREGSAVVEAQERD